MAKSTKKEIIKDEYKIEELSPSFKELFDRIEASTGLIFVKTFEENRLIRELKTKMSNDKVQFWSMSQGLHELSVDETRVLKKPQDYPESQCRSSVTAGKKTSGSAFEVLNTIEADCRKKIDNDLHQIERNIYVLRDLDKEFQNPRVIRKLRDIIYVVSTSSSTIIVSSPALTIPGDIDKDCAYIKLELPNRNEIKNYILKNRVQDIIKINNQDIKDGAGSENKLMEDNFDFEEITRACMGLTEEEIINTAAYSLTVNKKIEARVMLEEKRQIINKSQILTYFNCDEKLKDVGGFKNLKDWFKVQRCIMDNPEHADMFHAGQPKGIMLLGVQGSGKTLIGNAMASEWGKGLIELKMSSIYAGLVGQSESNMSQALDQAEAAGGILLIDEIDKGLAGAGSSDKTDGGTTKRVIGTLLSWMQKPHPGLFIIATANDITNLRDAHPELFRKGRFDELWFSDVPNQKERSDIFNIHLKKRGRDPQKMNIDIDRLSEIMYIDNKKEYGYVGAEIEYAIEESIRWNYALNYKGKPIKVGSKNDITTKDIEYHLSKIIPICKVGKVAVENNRSWAMDNAQNVSEYSTKKEEKKINSREEFDTNCLDI